MPVSPSLTSSGGQPPSPPSPGPETCPKSPRKMFPWILFLIAILIVLFTILCLDLNLSASYINPSCPPRVQVCRVHHPSWNKHSRIQRQGRRRHSLGPNFTCHGLPFSLRFSALPDCLWFACHQAHDTLSQTCMGPGLHCERNLCLFGALSIFLLPAYSLSPCNQNMAPQQERRHSVDHIQRRITRIDRSFCSSDLGYIFAT
ncbi:hypothetical protein B0H10DRAFT_1222358 [Mycena sp. CBHHK59/15]|nr:hypothetical protein B0H10DRAFT_412568 [Mycena sp. CBHHK59/15]KAJ6618659.1 hypothetical protein B0H10DRAFT_1222358 [Mycena sp. CBHHK59/15]